MECTQLNYPEKCHSFWMPLWVCVGSNSHMYPTNEGETNQWRLFQNLHVNLPSTDNQIYRWITQICWETGFYVCSAMHNVIGSDNIDISHRKYIYFMHRWIFYLGEKKSPYKFPFCGCVRNESDAWEYYSYQGFIAESALNKCALYNYNIFLKLPIGWRCEWIRNSIWLGYWKYRLFIANIVFLCHILLLLLCMCVCVYWWRWNAHLLLHLFFWLGR